MNSLLAELKARGLIYQCTDEAGLTAKLAAGNIALYCGFDPTADSLHLGHLLPLICLKHFQLAGHQPVAVVGGATALIGDPSFKATERKLNSTDTVDNYAQKITQQLAPFLNYSGENGAKIINNYDWFASLNLFDFLRDIGKHFSVNQMINRESVKQRLQREDSGISFTEFSYALLQAYDFAQLQKRYGVTLQLGGSDQWGNIVAGVDLTRRLNQQQVYGLTLPLITKSDGTKFGKTETDTIWLDKRKTSPYLFYQFLINTADHDVYRFLKLFTFLPLAEITSLEQSQPVPFTAQKVLAAELTKLVHGEEALIAAKRITQSLFSGDISSLTHHDFEQLQQNGIPKVSITANSDLLSVIVKAEFSPSKGQARALVMSNAITINGHKQNDIAYVFNARDILFQRYTLLGRGKKNYCLLVWQ